MNCRQVEENLSAYLDHELTDEENARIKNHLDSCSVCQKEAQALSDTISMLASLPEIIPPASFRRELHAKLEKTLHKKGFFSWALLPRWKQKIRLSTLMPVAVALVLMIVMLPFVADYANLGSAEKTKPSLVMDERSAEDVANSMPITGYSLDQSAAGGRGGSPEIAVPEAKAMEEASSPMLMAQRTAPTVDMKGKLADTANAAPAGEMERKIIKNADVTIQVENYQAAADALKKQVTDLGGYIANESINNAVNGDGITSGHLQVRVPQASFDGFLNGMPGLGKVLRRNVNSQDVTEEYIDVESRLHVMRVKEERLLSILAKSGQLSDVLAVENELANTRSDLESLEGRLRYLNNQTNFSNIGISLRQAALSTQQITTTGWKGILLRSQEAFIKAINNILRDTGKLVIFISSALPYLFIAFLAIFGIWFWMKKRNG